MREETKEKLLDIYNSITEKVRAVEQVFVHQFGREYVDSSLPTFDTFLDSISNETLGSMGINAWSDSNGHGRYTIDKEDYEQNGRGKKLLDYIPDLGILDYLKDKFEDQISRLSCDNSALKIAYILIRFPKVRVTNEYDKSIDITELYVRVTLAFTGHIISRFEMNRAEYTVTQWLSEYAHSHLPGIDRTHPENFRTPCTGSGPINRTIDTLRAFYDLNIWGLFAFELSLFVTVESIAGIPYRRLENVGSNDTVEDTTLIPYVPSIPSSSTYNEHNLQEFVNEFLSNEIIKISYKNGNYTLGEDFSDLWIKVSNAFIKWHNNNVKQGKFHFTTSELLSSSVINKYLVAEGIVYTAEQYSRLHQVSQYEGRDLFMFKGQMVKLHFIGGTQNSNTTYLVNKSLCFYILTKAIEIISCNYGRDHIEAADKSNSSTRCFYA